MTFDLTQPAPKPMTLAQCHQLIGRLWTYARSIKEKLSYNSNNSSLSPSSERFKKSTTKADNKESWGKRTSAYWKKSKSGAQKGHVCIGRKLLPIEQQIQAFDYVHLDEISHRRSGKTEWLWVACNDKVSLFKIFDNRSQTSAKLLLGENYQGMTITDRYGAYHFIFSSNRQYCWAHLKRDFNKIAEKHNPKEVYIGQSLLRTQRRLFYWYGQMKCGKKPYARPLLIRCIKRLYQYFRQGATLVGVKTARFYAKLLHERQSLGHFLKRPTINPTNNLAECNLRHAALWRKKTFGTKSKRGNQFLERMLTAMMTKKQLNENIIQSICDQRNLNKEVWVLQ